MNRRDFMKTTAVGATGAALVGSTGAGATTTGGEAKPKEVIAEGFGVYDEWGPLKEVFVGRADTARFPFWDDVYTLISPELQTLIQKHGGELIKDVWPEYVSEFQEQLDGLARAYEENGVKVHRPRPLTDEEFESDPQPAAKGVWQCCPADAVWVVGRNYIECQMRIALARKNYFWARDGFLPHLTKNEDARWLACPTSTPAPNMMTGPGPYLEGGDIILRGNGKDVLVGVDKYSTDEKAFKWLADALAADGYRCWPMTFDVVEIHLLAQMNLIGPKLGLIYREAFKNHMDKFPPFLNDYDWIDLTIDDVHNGGADVVMVNPKKVLVSQSQPRVAEELDKRGIEPQLVNIQRATEASAGIRCCTIIIHRQKA